MSASYGSDNPDCVGVEHLGEAPPVRSSSSKWKKAALATAGAALCLGGALIMYGGWSAPSLAFATGMTLESAATTTTTKSADQTNLMSGEAVLLRIKGKAANLCADDGGESTKTGDTYFTGQPCNPSNPNQLFIYDSSTYQFKSAKKQKLCIDDGGGWAGFTWLRLSKCDSKSENQRFKFDPSTLMLENPSKPGYCMDDGGGYSAGADKYTIWSCSSKNDNQHFEVLSQSTLAAEQKKVLDAVAGGAKFILRIAGKDGLCASGDGTATASASFTPAVCDRTSKKQLFSYDASLKRFRSSEKAGLCLDDGGGTKAAKTNVRLANCATTSVDQSFNYDSVTMMLSQPNKAGLCLDDGDDIWFTARRLILKDCDAYSKNQHFEFVLQTEPVTTTSATATSVAATPETDAPTAAQISASQTATYPETAAQVAASQTVTYPELSTYPSTSAQESSVVSASNQVTQQEPVAVPSTLTTSSPIESQTRNEYEVQYAAATTGETSQMTTTQAAMEPGLTMPQEGGMTSTTMVEPGLTSPEEAKITTTAMMEPGFTMPEEGEITSTTMMEPGLTMHEEGEITSTTMIEPGLMMPEEGEMTSTAMMEPDLTIPEQGEMTPMQPEMTTPEEGQVMEPGMMEPDTTTLEEGDSAASASITAVDASLTSFVGQDWNLLAPSESTLPRVNTDNSPFVAAADIFQYLQGVKDRADLEHETMMYRYKRTYECASAGLQTLVKDSVTTDQYNVLVRWMYEHCAAGNTNVAPPFLPPLPVSVLNSADVSALVDDAKTDVKRQFMTKMDFYYEIKNHFAKTSEKLDGDVAATHLRSTEMKALEQKMLDCINEASERFGYHANSPSYASAEHLKTAIEWVDASCMNP